MKSTCTNSHTCENTARGQLCIHCGAFRYCRVTMVNEPTVTNWASPWLLSGTSKHDAALIVIELDIAADHFPMPLSVLELWPGRFDELLSQPSLTPVEKSRQRKRG